MAARNGKCFHTVERHGKGIAHANHLPTVWGQCPRSEEHTSELQSQSNFVCRLLLEKKNLTDLRPVEPRNRDLQIRIVVESPFGAGVERRRSGHTKIHAGGLCLTLHPAPEPLRHPQL